MSNQTAIHLSPGQAHVMDDGTSFVRRFVRLGSGTPCWVNVEYDPSGTCLGGDAHWLSPDAADQALAQYVADLAAGAR